MENSSNSAFWQASLLVVGAIILFSGVIPVQSLCIGSQGSATCYGIPIGPFCLGWVVAGTCNGFQVNVVQLFGAALLVLAFYIVYRAEVHR